MQNKLLDWIKKTLNIILYSPKKVAPSDKSDIAQQFILVINKNINQKNENIP